MKPQTVCRTCLFDSLAFGDLRVSNHLVWRAELNEGELGVLCDLRCQGRLPTVGWTCEHKHKWFTLLSEYCCFGRLWLNSLSTLQEYGHQRSAVAVLGLLDKQLSVIQDVGNGVAPFDDPVHDVAGVILLVCAKSL